MNTRRLASVALAAAVVLGTTGCSMISPQATTIPYSAADGVNVPASGPLKVRNALFVANEDGTTANFLAAVVNDTDKAEMLLVGVDGTTKPIRVAAHSSVSLGYDKAEPLEFTGLDAPAGVDLSTSFQSGDGEAVVYDVPVLDGTLPYLADFVPKD